MDAFYCALSIGNAMALVDEATKLGIDRRLLRWRVGPAQRYAMVIVNSCITTNLKDVETGSCFDYGTFCGIPYFVDPSMPTDELALEQISTSPVNKIVNLAVPSNYAPST